jgi:predicted nucleic acid-binding protein
VLRLTSNAAHTVTGLADGTRGRTLHVINVGAQTISLTNQSPSSTARNRVITGHGTPLALAPDQSCLLVYDDETARWRVLAQS